MKRNYRKNLTELKVKSIGFGKLNLLTGGGGNDTEPGDQGGLDYENGGGPMDPLG